VISDKSDFFNLPPFDDYIARRVRHVPGVERSANLIIGQHTANLAEGKPKQVYLVGFDPSTGLGGPVVMTAGQVEDLEREMTVILDESSWDTLGHLQIGDKIEIGDQEVKIVGFCQGAVWMLGMPYVYTSIETSQRLLNWENNTSAVLLQAKPGAEMDEITERITRLDKGVQALTRQEAHAKFRDAWLVGTPAGFMSAAMVALGFLVGLTMVGITLYTATVERLREFGVLKAIGATNRDVYAIVLQQAFILTLLGYLLGVGGGLGLGWVYEHNAGMSFSLPSIALAITLLVVLGMSATAAIFAIRKVARIDPMLVFKG
jgi:putative ABC transport system permease protein